jgi:multidrug efflux pump subunit AcrB
VKSTAAWALTHPHVVWLVTLLALSYGFLTYLDLPRQENPTLADRRALVTTYVPGADPEQIELLVTKIIEEKLGEVDDIESIFAESVSGFSIVQVELDKGAPYAKRLEEIRSKIQETPELLPENASEPKVDTRLLRTNTMILAVVGEGINPIALRQQAKLVKRQLEFIPSIGRVELLGEVLEEIEVAIDSRALAERQIPLLQIVDALENRNAVLPSGLLELGGMTTSIQTSGTFDRVEEIERTYLGAGKSGLPITLAEVATVTRRLADRKVKVRRNGAPAVSIALEMLPGRNAIKVGESVRELVAELEPELVEGVAIEILADEPKYVGDRLENLTGSLKLGLYLVMAITLVGLGWRSGLIISISIPLSITVAMGMIGMFGVSIHQISIAAMVIAIGLVVDEDIIVVDNIQRHIDLGKSPAEASIIGLGEIHMAVVSGAGTTIAAFIPLAMMSGEIGEFVRSIPIAVCLMLITSVIVAHFFTPLFAATLNGWRRNANAPIREQHRFEAPYRRILTRLLRHRVAVFLGFFAIFFGSTCGIGSSLWPPDFFGDADRHQFLVAASLAPGTPVANTDEIARRIEAAFERDERIASWGAYVGSGVPKFFYNQFDQGKRENVATFVVNTIETIPYKDVREVAESFERQFDESIPGARVRTEVLKQGYGGGDAVRIFIQGESQDVLRALAVRVRAIVENVDGTENVRDSIGYDPLSLETNIDRAKANLLGISNRDIATTLRIAIDGTTATTFREDDEEIAIRVRLDRTQRQDSADLEDLLIYSPSSGSHVPLAQVASIVPSFTTRELLRYRRKPEVAVMADVGSARTLLAITNEVESAVLEQVTPPPGYEISFHGQNKEAVESFTSLARAAIAAVLLIYILLVIQFKSLSQPVLIILAIPMALIGAVWGLVITGHEAGFMAFLGMISLIGIVLHDSIVLLDYINTLRRRGFDLESAVITGSSTRLRAITMTSLTTIGGLLPLSIYGGATFGPFGFAMIFGLMGSTILTLIVQPVAYMSLELWRKHDFSDSGESSIPTLAVDSKSDEISETD